MMDEMRSQTGDSEATQRLAATESLPFIPRLTGTTGRGGEWCYQSSRTGAIWWELEPRWGCLAEAGANEGGDAWWWWKVSPIGNTAAVATGTPKVKYPH